MSNQNLTLRQKINLASRDPELVMLEQHGVVSANGNITALGRRIQADLIFRGGNGDMADLVEAVLNAYRAERAVERVLEEGVEEESTDQA